MYKQKALDAVMKIVQWEGVSVDEVISDIDAAIEETLEIARIEGDFQILAAWEQIPCVGERPSALELIAYIAERARDDMQSECQ